jgi:hypothetical protein
VLPGAHQDGWYCSSPMAVRPEPTVEDVMALTCAATPHSAYQIRARVRALVRDLPAEHPARRYGEEQIAMLDELGRATSKAAEGPLEPPSRLGWEAIPSHRALRR